MSIAVAGQMGASPARGCSALWDDRQVQALLRRWSQLRARFWGRLGSAVTRGPEDSPLIGARRNGRVCLRVFTPPDAAGAYAAWRDANADAYGSTADWEVDTGHAADGRDFVVVWVPAHHASPDD